ncbi:Aspartate--tRNA ligase, cytoplasmic [Sparassis crispa]|uniref:aspartate--tRNA ligase n=1 Tax=Sparassis crispa TaxID=139825 RepID=A0A401GK01_9APHY|nr:Aspartate--tRNA ligase, cytoplasmic [Sparassis crispa]GBE82498.1 Aspartate--tRNA ligase, cytoplasmic [Sparassis crispa]
MRDEASKDGDRSGPGDNEVIDRCHSDAQCVTGGNTKGCIFWSSRKRTPLGDVAAIWASRVDCLPTSLTCPNCSLSSSRIPHHPLSSAAASPPPLTLAHRRCHCLPAFMHRRRRPADATCPDAEIEVSDDVQYKHVLLYTRLNNRVVDLRMQTNQAVFKLQHAISHLFREYLDERGFTEIHSPKLQGTATVSGATVFEVGDFKGMAFLAQRPQLVKQMAIAADFERVYEIGPICRAEDSNTHRHMTEFTGLDLEMAIQEHYHKVMEMLDRLLIYMFSALRHRLSFKEAVDLLVEDGVPRDALDDIKCVHQIEKRLGRIVRAKYDTDYYIIVKFSMALRPFYIMPDPDDPTLSNSYDFFIRGEEILSGAQRIHDATLLAEKMRSRGLDPASISYYLYAFKMGCSPNVGSSIGLECMLMLFLRLNNICRTSLFPRDSGSTRRR